MIVRKRWLTRMGYRVQGLGGVKIVGREPFDAGEGLLRDKLLALGVFEQLGDGRLKYSAPAGLKAKDGTKYMVDGDGFVEFDDANLHDDIAATVHMDLADPDDAAITYPERKSFGDAEMQKLREKSDGADQ